MLKSVVLKSGVASEFIKIIRYSVNQLTNQGEITFGFWMDEQAFLDGKEAILESMLNVDMALLQKSQTESFLEMALEPVIDQMYPPK